MNDLAGLAEDIGKATIRFLIVLGCLLFSAGICLGYLFGRFA